MSSEKMAPPTTPASPSDSITSPDKTLEKAALKYGEHDKGFTTANAFKAGAEYASKLAAEIVRDSKNELVQVQMDAFKLGSAAERARILSLLRSEELKNIETDFDCECLGCHAGQAADIIEKRLAEKPE